MAWYSFLLFWRFRTPVAGSPDVTKVVAAEEAATQAELKEIESALESLRGARSYTKDSLGFKLIQGSQTNFKSSIEECHRNVLNARIHNDKLKILAERLEGDLKDIRSGRDKIIQDESRVLFFGKNFSANLQQVTRKIEDLLSIDLNSIVEIRYEEVQDSKQASRAQKLLSEIKEKLEEIKQKLSGLLDLENEVERLTATYVNS